jgi:ATP-dependent Clp protease ATP-binding subunit ClpA
MFERFTSSARQCLVLAQEEARELRHDHIGMEHILVAVAREPQGLGGRILRGFGITADELRDGLPLPRAPFPPEIDPDALAAIGIDLEEVRRRAEETFGPGALAAGTGGCGAPSGYIPFTPKSKKSLELALRSAVHLGDTFIGSEHLLLGLARVKEGVAADMVAARGVTVERLEAAIRDARRAA